MHEWLTLYSIGSYIDAKHNTKTWKIARITSICEGSLAVFFVGSPIDQEQIFDLDSPNLAQFRKHTSLYTVPKSPDRDLHKSTSDVKHLTSQLKSLPSSPFELTQLLRGSSCLLIDQLLDWSSEAKIENEAILDLFSTFISFYVDYIEKSSQFFSLLRSEGLSFEENADLALVLAWGEVNQTAKKLLGLEGRSYRVLSSVKHIPSYYKFCSITADKKTTLSYLVNLFASLGGFDRILELVSNTE